MKKILVVDDDPVCRKMACAMLRDESWEVTECETGLRGLELALNGQFQAMLLDISLDDVGGEDVCRRIRDNNPGLFIVAYTAHAVPEKIAEILMAGFNTILIKPVTAQTMAVTFKRGVVTSE